MSETTKINSESINRLDDIYAQDESLRTTDSLKMDPDNSTSIGHRSMVGTPIMEVEQILDASELADEGIPRGGASITESDLEADDDLLPIPPVSTSSSEKNSHTPPISTNTKIWPENKITTNFLDVQHLPSPVYPTAGRSTFRSNDSEIPLRQLHVKKVRSSGKTSNELNVPRTRHVSEMQPKDVETTNRDFSFANIRPVQRIVSIPLQSPMLQEKAFNKFKSLDEETETTEGEELSDDVYTPIIATFTTFSLKNHEQQVWKCTTQIGKGSFSTVYTTKDSKYAIKVSSIPSDEEETRLRIQSSLIRELALLSEIQHPTIVELIGSNSNLSKDQVIMVMPYYKGGDLFSYLLDNKPNQFNAEIFAIIFANVVSAVKYLHDRNICHRDIKLENVLLVSSSPEKLASNETGMLAVLSDFGLSKKIDPQNPLLTTRCGSEDYVSPELLLGVPYDGKQNDCWSLGVLLYAMLEGRLPFDLVPGVKAPRRKNARPAHRIAMVAWDWNLLRDNDVMGGYDWSEAKDVVNHLLVKRDARIDIDTVYHSKWCQKYIS
ncbi:hypothetical protein CANARDRAFT_27022 [[Candida] arabinofermentans NRRL YB-2248]|uniref:Protein kinase domain-containing protein n=1 Tax=[Candida] arabinofermentans NRRL YB-2248 TaxID=983967 RepID=A0A1E4T4J5_9ASCO|nr:hypothetical protein CANARDRAFT_27022 [[Candida] arabinofermentans NRRL YB-2248]